MTLMIILSYQGPLWAIQSLSYKIRCLHVTPYDVSLRYGGANPEFWVKTKIFLYNYA